MSHPHNEQNTDRDAAAHPRGTHDSEGGTDSREGDPRKADQQDQRTSVAGPDREVAKDDPSRAPESGTP